MLVGGAAVELYTGGAYVTGDLDLVGSVPRDVAAALRDSGFSRKGRHWLHEKGQVFVEFPGEALREGERRARLRVGEHEVVVVSLMIGTDRYAVCARPSLEEGEETT